MATTPNLGLYRPNRLDSVEVDVSLADNFDKIDTEVNGTKNRLDAAETKLTALEASQITATQKAETAITTVDSVRVRVDILEQTGGGGGGGTPGFIDGGSFLDTYVSQTSGLDGGEF